jgi:hypothetical protein
MDGSVLARASSSVSLPDFKRALVDRVRTLAVETGLEDFVLPIALVLVIDSEHGGDSTAQELVKRFRLLDAESLNAVDFYFLGWRSAGKPGESGELKFDLAAFEQFRTALRQNGVAEFGGNADLIILDARYKNRRLTLDFSNVMYLDLSEATKSKGIDTLGAFLQGLIEVGAKFRAEKAYTASSATFWMSDQLGLAVGKRSVLSFVLEKWGKVIGAKKLSLLVTRKIGPAVDVANL